MVYQQKKEPQENRSESMKLFIKIPLIYLYAMVIVCVGLNLFLQMEITMILEDRTLLTLGADSEIISIYLVFGPLTPI